MLCMEPRMKYYSLIIAAVAVALFAVQSMVPGFTEEFLLDSSLLAERPWTLLTSIFLHGSASHLIFNMFALVLFGLMLERFVGSKKFLVIFFTAGVIASAAAAFMYPASLGASGAVYGILGALAVIRPRMIVWTYGVPMPMIAAAGFYLLLDMAGLFFPSNVANAAHIAGLAAGAVIGLALREPVQKREKKQSTLKDEEFNAWEDEWM